MKVYQGRVLDDGYPKVYVYKIEESKVFDKFDAWLFKDGAIRIAASLKRDFQGSIPIRDCFRDGLRNGQPVLGEIFARVSDFNLYKAKEFLDYICEMEGGEKNDLDFIFNELGKEVPEKRTNFRM